MRDDPSFFQMLDNQTFLMAKLRVILFYNIVLQNLDSPFYLSMFDAIGGL
jgi:hypothetical protein